jgi:hypothetical protein
MKSNSVLIFALILALMTGCGGGGGGGGSPATKTLVSLALSPINPSISKGNFQQFAVTGTYSDNSTQDVTTSATWTSSVTSVAVISNAAGANGRATSVAVGATTITATMEGVSASTTLTVTPATLLSIVVSPTNPSISLGLTQQFAATGTYSDNSTLDVTTSATWTSSFTSVAVISNAAGANGRATSVAVGATTITAALGGVSASTTLTVTPATLLSITINPKNPSISMGSIQQFAATGTYSDSSTQDVTTSAIWTSSFTSVAVISNAAGSKGRATSVAAGATTITAALGGVSASTTLTVILPTLLSIAVSPTNPSISMGSTQQFAAAGTYSDNSTQDVTTSATWTSSFISVATISNAAGFKGRATSVAAGATTITAAIGGISDSTTLTVTGGIADNVIPITVNGSLCSADSYLNKPCISVTVCTPGTSTCQTISDVLLDTGSYGLRIFKQVLTVPLSQVTGASGSIAECVQFGDGSSMWGPVQTASVILANEPAVQVSIQVVDSTFGARSTGCSNADPTPAAGGFNGILGVGLFIQDCGTICANSASNGQYYACNGASCSGSTVPLSSQVQNPAALLPQDNNGVLVQIPSVPLGGISSITGNLILGIGTQSNNIPSSVTAYSAGATGEFTTQFSGRTYSSFIDSGSNGLFFTASRSLLPDCGSPNTGWFCPASTLSLSATNTGASGAPSGAVPFHIGNMTVLTTNSSINVFSEIGGTFRGNFDWGLPFFFGRTVIIGYDGSASSLGTGPYWAY